MDDIRPKDAAIPLMARTIFKVVEPFFAEENCEPNEEDYVCALMAAFAEAEREGYVLMKAPYSRSDGPSTEPSGPT